MDQELSSEILREKVKKRDQLEKELVSLGEEIRAFSHCNFEESLVDREGFPRPDIDFMQLVQYKNLKNKKSGRQCISTKAKICFFCVFMHDRIGNGP